VRILCITSHRQSEWPERVVFAPLLNHAPQRVVQGEPIGCQLLWLVFGSVHLGIPTTLPSRILLLCLFTPGPWLRPWLAGCTASPAAAADDFFKLRLAVPTRPVVPARFVSLRRNVGVL
jgi:hypothetical protein